MFSATSMTYFNMRIDTSSPNAAWVDSRMPMSDSSASHEVGNVLEIEPSVLSGTLRLPPSKSRPCAG